jgi:hypothetical protein
MSAGSSQGMWSEMRGAAAGESVYERRVFHLLDERAWLTGSGESAEASAAGGQRP